MRWTGFAGGVAVGALGMLAILIAGALATKDTSPEATPPADQTAPVAAAPPPEPEAERKLLDQPVTHDGAVVCGTVEQLEEFKRALERRDERSFNHLGQTGACVQAQEGVPVSILDESLWSGTMRVRLYLPDDGPPVEGHTFRQYIQLWEEPGDGP